MALPTITVKNAANEDVELNTPNDGRRVAADSTSMALDTETKAVLDTMETNQDSQISLAGAANTKLDAAVAALNTIDGRVDGLEALLTAGNALATTLNGYLDTVETLLGAGNTLTTTQNGYLDGVEGSLTSILAKIIAAPSTEAKQDALNTLITTQNGYLDGIETLVGATNTLLGTPLTELAKTPLMTASDLSTDSKTTSGGTVAMVAAVASQTTRLHAYCVIVPGAGTLEILDGSTMKRRHIFSAAGGVVRDFCSRPYAKTTANTALNMTWSGSGNAQIDFDYVTSA